MNELTNAPDEEVAAHFRKAITPHLQEACKVIDLAKAAGMIINFQLGPDQYGRTHPANLTIVKPL